MSILNNLKKASVFLLLFTLVAGFLLPAFSTPAHSESQNSSQKVKVLIGFKNNPGNSEQALVKAFGGEISYTYNLIPAIAATIPENAIHGLSKNPNVTVIETDGIVEAHDVEMDNSWGVKKINTEPVHSASNKGTGVKIAILDSGANVNHPDLNDNIAGAWDFVQNDNDPSDVYRHGTHVAGSACAEDNNNGTTNPYGVVGVAPECDLYILRVLNDSGQNVWSAVIAGMEWAVNNNIQVANLSLGSLSNPGTLVQQAFDNAEASGMVIVASAGNAGKASGTGDNVEYPAKYASVIAVAAVDSVDQRPTWSSTGPDVELTGPGVAVLSTWTGSTSPLNPQPVCGNDANGQFGCYKYGSGTSMSSPHVAGVAALVISAGVFDTNGNGRVNDEVRSILNSTARDLGTAGRDTKFGYGMVDAEAAVAAVGPAPTEPTANAGIDQTVVDTDENGTEQITLNGSASSDPNGTIISYDWHEGSTLLGSGSALLTGFGIGAHTVTLTVTDNESKTDTDTVVITVNAPQTQQLTLSTFGYKVKGFQTVDLTWSNAGSTNVDVYRNGNVITTTPNDGFYTNNIGIKGTGTYIYKVCEAGTSTCSTESTVVF